MQAEIVFEGRGYALQHLYVGARAKEFLAVSSDYDHLSRVVHSC